MRYNTIYFECSFTVKDYFYSMNFYDLPSDNEEEIREIIKEDGWDVEDIYGIKEQ